MLVTWIDDVSANITLGRVVAVDDVTLVNLVQVVQKVDVLHPGDRVLVQYGQGFPGKRV